MTENDKAYIIKLWNAKVPIYRIIRMLPYKANTVREMVRELKKDGTLQPRDRTSTEAIVNAYKSGMTNPHEIAETYGVSINTVYSYLSRSRVKMTRPHHNRKKDPQSLAIIAEIKTGKSNAEIARQFGVTRQWVYELKRRMEQGCYE